MESLGYVLFVYPKGGTAVVRPDNGDRDIWVHLSNVDDRHDTDFRQGERVHVEYQHIEHGPSGRWHGGAVRRLERSPGREEATWK